MSVDIGYSVFVNERMLDTLFSGAHAGYSVFWNECMIQTAGNIKLCFILITHI
jgi:hypothetical protein